ncbi:MAG TPA: HEAT repeat domain-containing protein [Bryobacteraceae bacterium]|nr:HEAT repeat domain-containing protein [Bryobacteraceae bacterium]
MCGHAKELMAASWLRELNPADEAALKQHLAECAECGAEMTALTAMWHRLGDLPAPEPSRALDVRWQATLESLAPKPGPVKWNWSNLWPRSLEWQMAVAAACLVFGLALGLFIPRQDGEIRQLRREITATRDMVALSLLQQQSATMRLRGVDYSGRMPSLEPEIVQALIHAVNEDPSVNVRLAAIDALGKAAGSGGVVASLAQSLQGQDSPMVQAALIDYLVDARNPQAVSAIEQFEKQPNLDPAVLERARSAVKQLGRN